MHETTYPLGGINKMWEPIHIAVNLGFETGITIHGRTWTRDGSQIQIFDEDKQEIGNHSYSFSENFNYHYQLAEDVAEEMNIMFGLRGQDRLVQPEQLYQVIKELRKKCESRFGNKLPDYDYEVLVYFH